MLPIVDGVGRLRAALRSKHGATDLASLDSSSFGEGVSQSGTRETSSSICGFSITSDETEVSYDSWLLGETDTDNVCIFTGICGARAETFSDNVRDM